MPPQGRIPKNNIEVLSYYSIIYIYIYYATLLNSVKFNSIPKKVRANPRENENSQSKVPKQSPGESSRPSAVFAVSGPLPGTWRSKKTDSGPDFRLTRSRHPSASGMRIGSSAGDGWAARRDPKGNMRVFYGAGL